MENRGEIPENALYRIYLFSTPLDGGADESVVCFSSRSKQEAQEAIDGWLAGIDREHFKNYAYFAINDEMWLYGPSAPDGRPQDDGGFVLGELLYNRERDFAEHKPIWVDGRFLGYGSQDMLDALNKYSHAYARYQEEHAASEPQEGVPVKIIKVSRRMNDDEFEVLQQRLWAAKVPYALENADREPKGTSEERRPRVLLIPERFEDILSKYFPDLRKRSDSIESSDPEGEFGIRVRSQAYE